MIIKSINIFTIFALSLFFSACIQSHYKEYEPDTAGYRSAPAQPEPVYNPQSAFRVQNPQQVPVIVNDPFSGFGGGQQLPGGGPVPQQQAGQQLFTPLGAAGGNNVIRRNAILPNSGTAPGQPVFGSRGGGGIPATSPIRR